MYRKFDDEPAVTIQGRHKPAANFREMFSGPIHTPRSGWMDRAPLSVFETRPPQLMTDASQGSRGVAALIAAAQQNDPEARDELVSRLYPKVQRIVHHRMQASVRRDNPWVRSLFSTGDVVHDVFMGVLGSVADIAEQGEEAVVAYLATAVQNRLLDMMRHHRAIRRDVRRRAATEQGGADPDLVAGGSQSPLRRAAAEEKLATYKDILGSFSPKYRAVLQERLEQNLSFAQIAANQKLPTADAARKMFHYAHAKLLAQLHAKGVKPDGLGGTNV